VTTNYDVLNFSDNFHELHANIASIELFSRVITIDLAITETFHSYWQTGGRHIQHVSWTATYLHRKSQEQTVSIHIDVAKTVKAIPVTGSGSP
jgi:hypothetical protein